MKRSIYTINGDKVSCTYLEYLALKLWYDPNGLTVEEMKEYKRLRNK